MRSPFIAAAAAAMTLAGPPAFARGFDVITATGPLSAPFGDVGVTVSPDIVERPTFVRRSSRELDTIGPEDVDDVTPLFDRGIEKRLDKAGLLSPDAPDALTLEVTITKVRASDLRFTEYGRRNNLRFGSVGAGGAEMQARIVDASGAVLGEYEYEYFENDALEFNFPATSTWFDARRAASWFAGHMVKEANGAGLTN